VKNREKAEERAREKSDEAYVEYMRGHSQEAIDAAHRRARARQ